MSKQIVDTVYQIRNAVYEKGQMLVELILVMGLFAPLSRYRVRYRLAVIDEDLG